MAGIKKCAGTIGHVSYDSSRLIYDRVRIVSIDSDGFMSCSCVKVQMYLMPCRHVCAIISIKKTVRTFNVLYQMAQDVQLLLWELFFAKNWLHILQLLLIPSFVGLEKIVIVKVVHTQKFM